MIGCQPCDDLGIGVQDRFANVAVVGHDGAAILQMDGPAIQIFKNRGAGLARRRCGT